MTDNMSSRVKGMIAACVSRGAFPKREPVAWLYNGVRLPGLPAGWNREKYPKLLIFYNDVQKLYAINMTEQGILFKDGKWAHGYTGYYESCIMDVGEGETDWGEITEHGTFWIDGMELPWSTEILWTNYDLYDTDGNLYLAASKPVPVYE